MSIFGTQTITWDVRINGVRIRNVVSVSTSSGFEQINAEATIKVAAMPAGAVELDTVEIWANNGTHSGHIFSGEVFALKKGYAQTYGEIQCRDLLARTRYEWGDIDYEYIEQDDAAVIRNHLEKMGIPSSQASILSSSWTLGVVDPVVLKEGDVVYQNIQEIDDAAGYKTFSLPTGVIVRRRITTVVGITPAMTFTKGVQILNDASWGRTIDGMYNKIIVEGLTYEELVITSENTGVVTAPNPYIPNPPATITLKFQSNLIEDNTKAYEVAQRLLVDKNRRPILIDFSVPFDPRPQPGMTAAVAHTDLVGGTAYGQIATVTHDLSIPARTTMRLIGGSLTLAGANFPPIAVFDYQIFREVQASATIYVVVCDGTQSYDPDGTIASYAWTITPTGGTATPTTGSAAVFTTILSAAVTSVVITLTVTDNASATGALVRTIPIEFDTTLVEDLYFAYGDAACTVDGEQNFRTATPASGTTTCLCPFGAEWGNVWGTTTGHIYATFDFLATALTDLGQPHGAVSCTAVWIHEEDQTRLWAGFTDGKVYFGALDVDGQTATWTLRGDIGASIKELRESVGTFNELRATAGASYYYSADGGASWAVQHTFDTAWRMAAGFDTNLASGLNDAAPLYDEDGTPPTVPGGVTHIRGLTFGWRDQELLAADNNANLYISTDPATFNLSDSGDNAPAGVNHMIRSGNIRRVVYGAMGNGTGTNGFFKWIPGTLAPFTLYNTGSAAGLMVGYGGTHLPIQDCITVHVPFDTGTSVVGTSPTSYGRLKIEELAFFSRVITGTTTFTSTIKTFLTLNGNGFNGIPIEAGVEHTTEERNWIDAFDFVEEFYVTFCNLGPA